VTNLLASTEVLGPFGIYEFGDNTRAYNPNDIRRINSEFTPTYESDETLVTLSISHQLDNHTLDFVGGYQETFVESEVDYLGSVSEVPIEVNPLLAVIAPQNYEHFFAEEGLPISADAPLGTGSVGGHFGARSPGLEAYDNSRSDDEQYTLESRMASDYDGNFNWLAGWRLLHAS
jgi:iron complex outermembrane recepter protein